MYFQRPLIRKRDICTSLGGWVNVTEPPGPQRASLLLRIKASNGSGCLKRPQSHTAHCYAIPRIWYKIVISGFRVYFFRCLWQWYLWIADTAVNAGEFTKNHLECIQAELGAAEVYPNFQKNSVFAVSKTTSTVAIFKISLPKQISIGS